jgi:L,D-transpeptidase ErfK/SrfK
MGGGGRAGIVALAAVLAGCGLRGLSPAPDYDEASFARKPLASFTIPTPSRDPDTVTVIGETRTVTVRDGDTLLDIARYHDLGYEELHDANPGLDPWVPTVGARVLLPTAFVLPCCTYEGLVINVPELRAYFYRPGRRAGTTIVQTFPLGLGRREFPTPRGVFHVRGKSVNPTWGVPESIRREHLRERGDGRRFIKGGDPDNPLGKYRLELDRSLYRIHGTNFPWGIGRLVSHGCVQLYPEDIEHLFPLVPIGTRVEFVYQPVKVGYRDGTTWLESHPDRYARGGSPLAQATTALQTRRLEASAARLRAAVVQRDGVPRVIHERRGGRS